MRAIIFITLLSTIGAVFILTPLWHTFRAAFMEERAYRAERLFRDYGGDVFRLAQKIEWGDAITTQDIAPVQGRINDRFGEDITFLFHALGSANIPAIDALIGAGADMTMDARRTPSPDFVYSLSKPGGPLLDLDGINELIRIYLKHGGDPNYYVGTHNDTPLVAQAALMDNFNGVRLLLDAGADPWANTIDEDGGEYNMMTKLSVQSIPFEFYDELIDQGYFDHKSQKQLEGFFGWFGSYAQRGDETSKEIQRIAMRVLKRNPHYVEDNPEWNTARIFKNHWQDPAPGTIPWDVINSDAVQ